MASPADLPPIYQDVCALGETGRHVNAEQTAHSQQPCDAVVEEGRGRDERRNLGD